MPQRRAGRSAPRDASVWATRRARGQPSGRLAHVSTRRIPSLGLEWTGSSRRCYTSRRQLSAGAEAVNHMMRHTQAAGSPSPVGPERQTALLRELAAVFLRLGLTAFGGPAAHIAMMEDEVVVRRRWLTRERFLDLLALANLLPGPSSSEVAIYLGYVRAGWPGLLVAGACFIMPAALLVSALAWTYTRFGSLPEIAGVLYGIRPVVVAIILQD